MQRSKNEWADFVEPSELILKHGLVQKKKKGPYITRTRMLILTSKPRLIYIDPFAKIKKGEIPFDSIRAEAKNFKLFFLHTVSIQIAPERTIFNDLVAVPAQSHLLSGRSTRRGSDVVLGNRQSEGEMRPTIMKTDGLDSVI